MTATSPATTLQALYSNIGKAVGTDYLLLKGRLSARDYLERTRRFVHEDALQVKNGFGERAETYRFTGVVKYPRLIWLVDNLPECSTGKCNAATSRIPYADNS